MKTPGFLQLEWLLPIAVIGLTLFTASDHYSREKAIQDTAGQRTLQALKTRIEQALDNRKAIVAHPAGIPHRQNTAVCR